MIEKMKQGNIQRAQRYQVFPSEVVYSELFTGKHTTLSHLTPSLIYDVREVRNFAKRG